MSISFADLVQVYSKSEFLPNSDNATYLVETEDELILLKNLSSDNNLDTTALDILDENPQVGDEITLEIRQPKISFGRIFNTINDFICGDMAQLHNQSIQQSPYYIKSENTSSFDKNPIQFLVNYQIIKNFLHQLIAMDSYTDTVNEKLIFFSKKTFELSVDIQQKIDRFIELLSNLDSEQCKLISDFREWLNDEETSSHIDEKKSILAFVLSDALPQDANLIDLIEQIQNISESVQSQYALYLENFSYEKFVKKLEENSEKFVSKINDTISKILPQFLGLPFLTAIPTALKSADNWLVYLALIIYCIMCIYGLNNQKAILNYINQDIERYENKGKIPEKLKAQWAQDKKRIKELLRKQRHLYRVLMTAVILFLCYGVIKFLFQIHILEAYCK
ncbi:hypothetical protein [Morganella morganii]|uniref:hypothetical protein n=1 Tax=Morganella morganii TaxID=582 RepID=UPI0032DA7102